MMFDTGRIAILVSILNTCLHFVSLVPSRIAGQKKILRTYIYIWQESLICLKRSTWLIHSCRVNCTTTSSKDIVCESGEEKGESRESWWGRHGQTQCLENDRYASTYVHIKVLDGLADDLQVNKST
jgi:hypothetical protein